MKKTTSALKMHVAAAVAAAKCSQTDEGYDLFERQIKGRVNKLEAPLFTTDADPAALWAAYLDNIPKRRRQHYNCRCCRKFIERYAGLVTIDKHGVSHPAVFGFAGVSPFFAKASEALARVARRAKVTGVFYSSDSVWGTASAGGWTHLSGAPSVSRLLSKSLVKTPDQQMAEKREEFGMLCRGIAEFPIAVVRQALAVLKADNALTSAEKTVGVAEWLLGVHETVSGATGVRGHKLLWLAVASAPVGFCHVRSSMIGTLLEDIQAGLPFEDIKKRWAAKMHPLQYQRPTAAPKSGTIDRAEKLVEQLGLARSLERRYGKLDDVLEKLWTPELAPPRKVKGGVFGALREPAAGSTPLDLSATAAKITFEKFRRTVLPSATSIEVRVPATSGSFYGLLTATHADAPPIIQWDGLDGFPRNPTSWFFYASPSTAAQWTLSPNSWAKVNAVFLSPHQWQKPDQFPHHRLYAMFAVEGCRDNRGGAGLCLFPELIRNELREVRSVIERHSNSGKATGVDQSDACGLAFGRDGKDSMTLRVRMTDGVVATYTLDRWD